MVMSSPSVSVRRKQDEACHLDFEKETAADCCCVTSAVCDAWRQGVGDARAGHNEMRPGRRTLLHVRLPKVPVGVDRADARNTSARVKVCARIRFAQALPSR
jgi:hypothetical protein